MYRGIGRIVLFVAMVLNSSNDAHAGGPSDTVFTYQGQLKQNDFPITSNCDFQVALFEAESGGIELAVQNLFKTDVVNGLFSLAVDFGEAQFNGSSRFLEVRVDCGPGGFVTLSPRHEITPTPESLHSNSTRGIAVDDTGRVGIGIDTPSSALHLRNQESVIALKMRASGSWTAELRQTNGSLLSLVNGGSERMTILPNGRIGIGTTSPDAELHVNGSLRVDGDIVTPNRTGHVAISPLAFTQLLNAKSTFAPASGGVPHLVNEKLNEAFSAAAPIQLPHGANLKALHASVEDAAGDADVEVRLYRSINQHDLSGWELVGLVEFGGYGFGHHLISANISPHVVDNSGYSYLIWLESTGIASTSVYIYGVSVEYEVNTVLP